MWYLDKDFYVVLSITLFAIIVLIICFFFLYKNYCIDEEDEYEGEPLYEEFKKSNFEQYTGLGYIDIINTRNGVNTFLKYRELENEFTTSIVFPRVEIGEKKYYMDYVLLDDSGIYLIIFKNFDGFLEGNEDDDRWLYKKNRSEVYSIKNPLHIAEEVEEEIAGYLGCDVNDVYSFTVFKDSCRLGKVKTNPKLSKKKDFISRIRIKFDSNDLVFSRRQFKRYSKLLDKLMD